MAYIKVQDGKASPYSIAELRKDNRNVSFPDEIPANVLAAHGVFEVTDAAKPVIDNAVQAAFLNDAPSLVEEKWVYEWTVREKTDEERQKYLTDLSETVRSQPNFLLDQSDWTQVTVAPEDHIVWAEYRQSLRDITGQEGFPTSVVWPVAPFSRNP